MSEPRYPLKARLSGGRVRHMARTFSIGIVVTACGKRGPVADDGTDRPLCTACASKPNPQDCRSYAIAPDSVMDEFEAADDIDRRWE